MIDMECPHCNHPLRIDDHFAGRSGICKHCNESITVPGSSVSSDDSSTMHSLNTIENWRESWQKYLTTAQLNSVVKKVDASILDDQSVEVLGAQLVEIGQLNVQQTLILKRFKKGIAARGAEGEVLTTKVEEKHRELLGKLRNEIATVEQRLVEDQKEFDSAKHDKKTYKIWITVGDDIHSDIDVANEAQGWIPIDEPFVSGHQVSPSVPSCRCRVSYRKTAPDEASVARAEERIQATQKARKSMGL